MSQESLIKLACTVCKRVNYWTRKNKRKLQKIELKSVANGAENKHHTRKLSSFIIKVKS